MRNNAVTLKLTVIDQSPIHSDRPAGEALSTSVELSIACDALGYFRYGSPNITTASTSQAPPPRSSSPGLPVPRSICALAAVA